jgi:hypothetical protein
MRMTHSSLRHVSIRTGSPGGGSHRRHRNLTTRGRVVRGIVVLALMWVAVGIAVPALLGHGSPGLARAAGHQHASHHATVAGPVPNPSRPWMY